MLRNLPEILDVSLLQRWVVQAVFIVLAVLLSILVVTWILEKSLVKNALELEADAFIAEFRQDASFPLPRTRNLVGYLSGPQGGSVIPSELNQLTPGLHLDILLSDRHKSLPVLVRDFDGYRLYLVFEGANVDRLVGIFGLVPLTFILIVIYISSWIAYRVTWRAVSPVLRIADTIRHTDTEILRLNVPVTKLTGETRELAMALEDYSQRIQAFIERERQFTADVSHELRTPMTIIDGAAQFLSADTTLSERAAQRIKMIRRACHDVNELISAFLLLAREPTKSKNPTFCESVFLEEVIEAEIQKLSSLDEYRNIEFIRDIRFPLNVSTPRKVLEIILGNICRNACKYAGSGQVIVGVTEQGFWVADNGPGIEETVLPHIFERHVRGRGHQQAGEGIGLAIVKRLSDQFGWEIAIQNREQGGVVVTLLKVN
jgi:signal transduction histidine kinase